MTSATEGAQIPQTDGVIKINYGQRGDVIGGLGPNPWQFSLLANTEIQINPPLPSTFSTSTRWSDYVRGQDDTEVFIVDPVDGTKIIEQNIDRQVHYYRMILDYQRSDSSTDEQIQLRFVNPSSGFSVPSSFQMLRGNLIAEGKIDITTIADDLSIPENGLGAGYQIFIESTTPLDVSIRSIVRVSQFESRGIVF